jgi:hypothetical protein
MAGFVGLRLLWLAWRSRELPELLIGAAFTGLIFVAAPLMGAAGMGRVAAGEIRFAFFVPSLVAIWLGLTCLTLFTWKTFHAQAGWAKALTLILSLSVAIVAWGMISSLRDAPPEMISFEAARFWSGMLRAPIIAIFLWSGASALHAHHMARRRMALGLSDPVVVDRLLLWGLVGLFQAVVNSTSLVLHLRGVAMMADPVGLSVVAVGGLLGALSMYLTFLPPRAYLRFVRRRAGLQEG